MNRSSIFRTLWLCFVLIIGVAVAQAQTSNLLTNPGFESPFEPVPDSSASMVAQGWTAWSVQTGQNQPPEYYPATDTTNGMLKPRIHSGSDAQQYFTFFAAHTGGVYQHVTGVAAGDQLTFSVYVYVWSSSGDNVDVSDGSGDLSVQVGIDPTGGTDGTSSAIVWSNPLSVVDQYAQHTVSAVAAGDNVTVFVRSTVNKVAMNNVVYLDDADLSVTGTGAIVPASTAQATEAVTAETVEPTTIPLEVTQEVTVAEVTQPVAASPEATEVVTTAAATEVPTVQVATLETITEEVTQAPSEAATEIASAEATQALTAEAMVTTEVPTATPTDTPTSAPTATPTDTATPLPPTDTPTPAPPTNTPTPVPPTNTPTPTSTLDTTQFPLMYQYTVVRGDTVGALATRFGSTVEAIIIANQLNSNAYIYETQILMIPVKTLPTATPLPTDTPTRTPTSLPPTATLVPPTATPLPPTPVPATPTETAIPVLPANTIPQTVQNVIQPSPTPFEIVTTYVVAYGDTLSSIASRFGVATMDLARVNQIVNPNLIHIGQVLNIPASGTPTPAPSSTATATNAPTSAPQPRLYQVQPGDNLYSISVKLNVPISALIEANGIYDANRIYVGQILIVP